LLRITDVKYSAVILVGVLLKRKFFFWYFRLYDLPGKKKKIN